MKYLVKLWTSSNTSYMMDVFLEEQGYGIDEDIPLKKRLAQHAAITNEIDRNKRIIKIEFFEAIPESTWEKK